LIFAIFGRSVYYLQQAGNVFISFHLSVNRIGQNFSSGLLFMKPYRIMVYCYGKNPISFGVDSTQSGRMAAILDFYYICANIQKCLRKVTFLIA